MFSALPWCFWVPKALLDVATQVLEQPYQPDQQMVELGQPEVKQLLQEFTCPTQAQLELETKFLRITIIEPDGEQQWHAAYIN